MIILLKYWREIVIVILIVIAFTSVRSCRNQAELVQLEKHSHDSTYHEAVTVKLKNGQQAFRIKILEATVHQLRGEGILDAYTNKQLRDQIGSLNNLVGYWKGKASIRDSFKTVLRDTLYIYRVSDHTKSISKIFNWHGKYLSIDGLIHSDTVAIDYKYAVDFSLTAYRKGGNLFKRGQLVSDITFSDPKMRVTSFQGVVVKEAPKRWYETRGFAVGVGFAAGLFAGKK